MDLQPTATLMSLTYLVLLIVTIALVLTLTTTTLQRNTRHWPIKFLQFFCGSLFLVSGFVKAVDPLGTAFKMEQYFAEFETTFSGTWFSFLSPLFPALSSQSVWFSIFMIVLELALGAMLLLGVWRKLTAWAFFLVILFFTVLTGFTYLTGYVPSGVNFFAFGEWDAFEKSNMRVTDCGCFGDFIKLEPKVSFLKDVFLLLPAILFLFYHRSFQRIFNPPWPKALTWTMVVVSLLFCFRNVWWNEPLIDFRPFRAGVDLRGQKAAEADALANVPMTMVMKNKSDGSEVRMSQDEYMKVFKDYPKEEWEYLEPIKGEPAIPITKINDFEVSDSEGNDYTTDILDDEGVQFLVISYSLKDDGYTESTLTVQDTIWAADTLQTADSIQIVRRIEQINRDTHVEKDYQWTPAWLDVFRKKIIPLVEEASGDGAKVRLITKYAEPEKLKDLKDELTWDHEMLQADDILLKTIIRSNPGVVLMKDGKILAKWHHRQLPAYQEIKSAHLP